MSTNGKGSKPRPFSVSYEQFLKSWDNIFRSKTISEPLDDTNTHITAKKKDTHNDKRNKRKKRLRNKTRSATNGNESS